MLDVCEFCGQVLDSHFCFDCCELMGEDAYLAALEVETVEVVRLYNLVGGVGTGESKECPTCHMWSAQVACPNCIRKVFIDTTPESRACILCHKWGTAYPCPHCLAQVGGNEAYLQVLMEEEFDRRKGDDTRVRCSKCGVTEDPYTGDCGCD